MYILASDFDGTLNRHGGVSAEDRAAIARFRACGNKFGIVSGRAMDMYDMLKNLKIDVDFVIVFNGAAAMDGEGNTLFTDTAENRMGENGMTLLHEAAQMVGEQFHTWFCSILVRDRHVYHADYPEGNEKYTPIAYTDTVKTFTHLNIQCKDDDEAAVCTEMLRERYSDVINPLQNGCCIDMPPKGIDKAVGILRYAKLIGAEEDKIYTAGDNCNDIAMLKRFHGCAVTNAREDVKAISEGVYDGIHEMVDMILAKDNA
ncbi:MAG: Cof-type HAD-IIB family hydrolase [Clostridia bacterium]|nr:Cof-type HAD-IIB family hydrolase [Clostridia bacterium]